MSKNQDQIQVLPSKSSLKSISQESQKPVIKKKVSFVDTEHYELPKRIITRPSPIRTAPILEKKVFPDTNSDISSRSSIDQNRDLSERSGSISNQHETPKSSWWFSNKKQETSIVEAPRRMNPFAWVSSKIISFVKAAQSVHNGAYDNRSSVHHGAYDNYSSFQNPESLTLPKKVLIRPSVSSTSVVDSLQNSSKRDSGISINDGEEKQSKPKVHVCRFCGGTTMLNPYKLCPECEGTGISDTNLVSDIYQSSKRVVFSFLEWIAPSNPTLIAENIPMKKITSYPRTSFDSNSSGVRNPRSSLDPGPRSEWSQELDFRRVTKQYVKQKNQRRSMTSSQLYLASTVSTNLPLKRILQTVEAPSEIGFTDLVERHC